MVVVKVVAVEMIVVMMMMTVRSRARLRQFTLACAKQTDGTSVGSLADER